MNRSRAHLALFFATLMAIGCGRLPPPPEYVGTWEAEGLRLDINPRGDVEYQYASSEGGRSTKGSMRGIIQLVDGRQLRIRFITGERVFLIDKPPHRDPDARWRMTLDKGELIRVR